MLFKNLNMWIALIGAFASAVACLNLSNSIFHTGLSPVAAGFVTYYRNLLTPMEGLVINIMHIKYVAIFKAFYPASLVGMSIAQVTLFQTDPRLSNLMKLMPVPMVILGFFIASTLAISLLGVLYFFMPIALLFPKTSVDNPHFPARTLGINALFAIAAIFLAFAFNYQPS